MRGMIHMVWSRPTSQPDLVDVDDTYVMPDLVDVDEPPPEAP